MTDFRALCAELTDALDDLNCGFNIPSRSALIERASAALAEPEPEGPSNEPQIGDYVLATKWSDGDPCDHFCVGFFAGKDRDRYKVVDSDCNLFRGNGFRRCETITQKEGESILSLKIGDKPGPSVWWHLERIRGIEVQPEPEGPTDEEIMELMPQQMRDDLAAAARVMSSLHPDIDKTDSVFRMILNRHSVDHARAVLARWGQLSGVSR